VNRAADFVATVTPWLLIACALVLIGESAAS